MDDERETEFESASDHGSEIQAGVRKVEAISASWTKWGLVIAYVAYVRLIRFLPLWEARLTDLIRLLLIANCTSLEVQVTSAMTPFATSAYRAHSLVSTVTVVQGVVNCWSTEFTGFV
jgi:hypothetical protein